MEKPERIDQSLTCDRCNHTERWIGTAGYVTFPDGWWLVFPEWDKPFGTEETVHRDSFWVCANCLADADHDGWSWSLRLSSDAGAPLIELVEAS